MKKKLTGTYLLIGAACDTENIRYLSGFQAPDPFLALYKEGSTTLVVNDLELGRAKKSGSKTKVLSINDLPIEKGKAATLTAQCLALVKLKKIKSVIVSPFFPVAIADALREKKISVRPITKGPLFPAREFKTKSEIEKITASQKATAFAMKAAMQLIESSSIGKKNQLYIEGKVLTSEKVKQEIRSKLSIKKCGAEKIIVACGDQATDPHEEGLGPLIANQTIIIDIFPQHEEHGYWGDMTRTVLRGKASPEQKKLYRTVQRAQTMALNMLKPGQRADEIHQAIQKLFEKEGFPTEHRKGVPVGFFHGTGHGVGQDIHEAPSIGRSKTKLAVGHVITIEPGLYYPGLGGVRIEDTVVITKMGYQHMARCGRKFEL